MTSLVPDLPYWIAFTRVPSVGRVRVGMLEERFGSLEAAWGASAGELRAAGLDPHVVSAITEVRPQIDPDEELERVQAAGIGVLTWHDPAYPRLLREIDDLPPVLYVQGELTDDDQRSVTVVGTRKPTSYGKEVAAHLAGDLARAGVTIVSGLARGIDGVAHRAALEAGGRTIGVLGSGLDVPYPPEHVGLMRQIAEQGAVISEYPLGTKPEARHFPRRNRVLSGLSLGTLVVEAPEQSGTLSTIRSALEQNREVFCVPGSIYSPQSAVTNRLIQEGAKLVMAAEDILEELNLSAVASHQTPLPGLFEAETGDEAALYEALNSEPQHIDDLSRRTEIPVTRVTGTLAVMELKGQIRQVGRMNYVRARGSTTRDARA
ncbi:MAG: DNA-processing protein DprA [Chloroflexi bacterium]|nr:DNA-processing protein DprA [Chloroflexota bacterium]